ncbi:hypothetical protein GQ457_16G007830 [Hibiscus cannabinus]
MEKGRRKVNHWDRKALSSRHTGFSVFIDNVSKRIHRTTLGEAFEEYGKVLDVFVAYHNIKRRSSATTFAFVRFRLKGEAQNAIVKANGRIMDGFRIRVFDAIQGATKREVADGTVKRGDVFRDSIKDSRTYKEVLVGKDHARLGAHSPQCRENTIEGGVKPNAITVRVEEFSPCMNAVNKSDVVRMFQINKQEMEWRNYCLVGNIKAMYNIDIVQDALISDGFQATVCQWYGLLSVIRFPNKEERDRCWNFRGDMLKLWFDELELLEGFEGKRKIKTWVKLIDVPLDIWCTDFFHNIGSRWGTVIEIDEETRLLKRFDEAKFVVQVQRVSCIPDRLSIFINGVLHQIKVETEDFEGDRIFIDGGSPACPVEEGAGIEVNAINANLPHDQGDQSVQDSGAVLLDVPIIAVGSSDIGANSGFSIESGPSYGAKTRAAESLPLGAKLLNVPVGVYSPNSLGDPIEPHVEEEAGENVSPDTHNRFKRGKTNSGGVGCDRFNWWVHRPSGKIKAVKKMRNCSNKAGRGSGLNANILVGNIARVNSIHNSPELSSESESEASKTFGLSKLLKVKFKAPDGVVLSRLAELDKPRKEFLDSLDSRFEDWQIPVVVGGDFNTVKQPEEKIGLAPNPVSMSQFREFIQNNNLIDIPPVGSRGLSDHRPVVLTVESCAGGPKPFKWFSHWADIPELAEVIRTTARMQGHEDAPKILRAVKGAIKAWVKDFHIAESESIPLIERKVEELEERMCSEGYNQLVSTKIQSLQSILWAKFRREEREWLQKSRVKWFKEGDMNTKFFHLLASLRKKHNSILSIHTDNGILEGQASISRAFEEHFKKSFNSSLTLPVASFGGTFRRLSEVSAKAIEAPFSEAEIWNAIKCSDGNKAPGPDGFNLDFYKKFWPSLRVKVISFFKEFYKGKLKDKSVNHSFITLIPKVSCPKKIDDFRPISLVNSLYKILAKVLSKRLDGCLEEVIGVTQFAFLKGKQILDCSFIANEVIDDLKRRKREVVVFKADFRKAYDSVAGFFWILLWSVWGLGSGGENG